MARVLIADDSADIRTLLIRILSRDEHAISEVADGAAAYQRLITERYDIAILDVMMPQIDGLTLCRMLRDTPGLGHLGIVVISAASSEVAALAAGADAFLSKPFLPSTFLETVATLASGGHAPRMLRPAGRPRQRRKQSARLTS